MNYISIVERINTRLAEKGWTGYDLAKYSGISSSTIYRILNQQVQPRNDTVDRIFETLGMPKQRVLDYGFTLDELSSDQVKVLEISFQFTPKQMKHLIAYMRLMQEHNKDE